MESEQKRLAKVRKQYAEALKVSEAHVEKAEAIMSDMLSTHNIEMLKEALHSLFKGYVSTPLELSPEDRLDMVVNYEFLENHLKQLEALQASVNVPV